MSFKFKKPERQLSLPQEELDLLNEKEFSMGEVVNELKQDTKNLLKGMDEAVGIGGASGLTKIATVGRDYHKGQSENYLLSDEEREISHTKMVDKEEDIIRHKKEYDKYDESVEEIYGALNFKIFKGAYQLTTGMIRDYSDPINSNLMLGMNVMTGGLGRTMYGATKTSLLLTDVVLGGLENANLSFQTKTLMTDEDIKKEEIAWSFIHGMIGESALPILSKITGLGWGKVVEKVGKKTTKEILGESISGVTSRAKADLDISKTNSEVKYGKGNYDKNVVKDASDIEVSIDDVGTYTGVFREEGDTVIKVNGESKAKFDKEKVILDNIELELQKITGSKTLAEEDAILDAIEKGLKNGDIEAELRAKRTGKERPTTSGGKIDLKLFTKDQKADKEIAKLFEGKKELTIEELRNRRRQMTEQMERDVLEDEGLAVNDITVDNAKATSELFTPKKLVTERQFGSIIDDDILAKIEKGEFERKVEVKGISDAMDSMSDIGELKVENIARVNDFIDEHDLVDEGIHLLKEKLDGTIDFGNKTQDEFVSDFKILLQLFSDPIDKTTPEARFKNVTLREATKLVKSSKEILKTLLEKGKEKTGKPLTIKERSTLTKNFIKENLYNSYKYAENKNMTKLHLNTVMEFEGNRYGAVEIFNLMETDGDVGFLGKALFDGKIETKTKGTGLAMRKFKSRFEDQTRLFVEGNFKTDFDNVYNSLLFDRKSLYYDSLDESISKKITNDSKEIDFNKISLEEKAEIDKFAFDVFKDKNSDLFPEKTAKIIWDNVVGKGKSASQLEGTVLHGMGELQKFADEEIIDKATLSKLVDRYKVSDRVLYNRMVKTSSNANALYSTFGYKPKNTMNRMFGNYSKANPLTRKSNWLFGESEQAWTLKTDTNNFANLIFDDEIGRTGVKIPLTIDKILSVKAKGDSMMLGLTDLPSEIGTHVAKRLVIGKEPVYKVAYQTIKTVLQMHSLTKKIANETNDTFLRENVGALGSYYEFLITKGDTDYSGSFADNFKNMTPKQKTISRANRGIGKANAIRQVDLFGDKVAMVTTHYDINKLGKIGYKELMSKKKHNYIASKLDEFGIGEDSFKMMVDAKKGDFGIRDYAQYTRKDFEIHNLDASLELKKLQDFTTFYSSKIGFTKPDVEFSKGKNSYSSDDDRFLSAIQMYWKKTMYTKLKDVGNLYKTMNTYGGLNKTFDWVNVDHFSRVLAGSIAMGLGNYGSDKLDKLVFGYEGDEADTITEHAMSFINASGGYVLTDRNSLQTSLSQVVNGKSPETKLKGVAKLVLPKKPVRVLERVFGETK